MPLVCTGGVPEEVDVWDTVVEDWEGEAEDEVVLLTVEELEVDSELVEGLLAEDLLVLDVLDAFVVVVDFVAVHPGQATPMTKISLRPTFSVEGETAVTVRRTEVVTMKVFLGQATTVAVPSFVAIVTGSLRPPEKVRVPA